MAKRVREGKLPTVLERLPKQLEVVKLVEGTGKYDGTWNSTPLAG